MIADLKADSKRWEAERRATASRRQPLNDISLREYDRQSRHYYQSGQYHRPIETEPGAQTRYQIPTSAKVSPQAYNSSAQAAYPQQSYAMPSARYPTPASTTTSPQVYNSSGEIRSGYTTHYSSDDDEFYETCSESSITKESDPTVYDQALPNEKETEFRITEIDEDLMHPEQHQKKLHGLQALINKLVRFCWRPNRRRGPRGR